jgi:mono/diheme cytochrome c family protein
MKRCARSAGMACAVVASVGFLLAAGSSVELSVAAAALQPAKNPIPSSEASIKAGGLVYAKNCRACHGIQGKGDGTAIPPGVKPANLIAGQWKHGGTDADLFKTIKEGVAPAFDMQAWGDRLSDDDIWNAINYIRDLTKKVNARSKK